MTKYPNAFYRVSVKAIIRNELGRILLVKEGSENWSLPGGGLDHGEDINAGLKRELFEELGTTKITSMEYVSTYTLYSTTKEAWFMWLLHNVVVENFDVEAASDVSEAAFIDINSFQGSSNRAEQRLHEALTSISQ